MAGGGGAGANSRDLDQAPTWAVASVCAAIIIISVLLEQTLRHIGQWFTSRRKKALYDALEIVKSELMVLGFISLLLTFGQNYIAQVCISAKAASTMLPCHVTKDIAEEVGGGHRRRILWHPITDSNFTRRVLAGGASGTSCPKGRVPLISLHGLHQLHIFIFFLAVFHVAYSALTMILGKSKIRGWKEWEKMTSSSDYEFSSDPLRFRFPQETTFVKQHTRFWNRNSILLYIVSFFNQIFRSVRKTDYLIMRHGFITEHLAPGSKFNFQKYINRSLEDDFKVVVGISPILWASAVTFLLLNVTSWQALFWVSLIPLIIILAVGTKLRTIIAKMAVEIQEKHTVIQGVPLVQLSDQYFWFGRPHFILFLIHFTLFQNAFQIIYFFWIWYEFGLNSCFHDNFKLVIIRVCLGVGVQFLCSYVTLPLYALVSQMGSSMKKSIFNEQTSKVLRKWHQAAKKRHQKGLSRSTSQSPGTSPLSTPNASAVHPLGRFRSIVLSDRSSSSPRRSYSDIEISDAEVDMQKFRPTIEPMPIEHELPVELQHVDGGFSFAKPPPIRTRQSL